MKGYRFEPQVIWSVMVATTLAIVSLYRFAAPQGAPAPLPNSPVLEAAAATPEFPPFLEIEAIQEPAPKTLSKRTPAGVSPAKAQGRSSHPPRL